MIPRSLPIRIAYVVHGFHAGGLERCVARLADGLDRTAFRAVVICLERSGEAAKWLHSPDVPIVELGKAHGNGLRLVTRLASAFRRLHIDIAHSHNWGTLIETALACRLVNPRVRHLHAERGTILDGAGPGSWRYRLRSIAARFGVRSADAVLSNSTTTRRLIAAIAATPESDIHLIPNGLDAPLDLAERHAERCGIRDRLGISSSDVVFGTVGRLAPVKDLTTAVRAVALAGHQGVPARLIIVGSGPEQERIVDSAAEAGIADRLHLVGHQSQIGPWLAAMDVYVNTSISEGMSQSVVEAMAMGLPLIVTDVGDHRRLVEAGDCGRVVAPGDAAAIGRAMAELVCDESLRTGLGVRAAAAHAADHSLATMVARYERLYLSLVEGRCGVRNEIDRKHDTIPGLRLCRSR